MDDRIKAVLEGYEERAVKEHAMMRSLSPQQLASKIDELLISVGPVVGSFMNELVKSARAKVILELGTSHGHSTIYLAEAARQTGGHVHTTELSSRKIGYARERLEAAGLSAFVTFHEGDARETIERLSDRLDFVLVDLWKDLYVPCFQLFYPKLAPGALIVADNMIEPESARDHGLAYRRAVEAAPYTETVLLPLGQGIAVSRYTAGLDKHQLFPAVARQDGG